jgi:Ca2+/H+ antiporter, TMEM165/GDT1 family
MDWRVFMTTFGVIFLAASTRKPLAVFIGAAVALVFVSAIGVVVGGVLSEYLPLIWIKRVSAVAFIVVGVLILMNKM